MSPSGHGKTFGGTSAARYNEYVTSGQIKASSNAHAKRANDSLERPNPNQA